MNTNKQTTHSAAVGSAPPCYEKRVEELEMALFMIYQKMQKASDCFADLIYKHGGESADFNYRGSIYSAGVTAGLFLGSTRLEELQAEDEEVRAKFKAEMEAHIST